jgi:hypothetical protein
MVCWSAKTCLPVMSILVFCCMLYGIVLFQQSDVLGFIFLLFGIAFSKITKDCGFKLNRQVQFKVALKRYLITHSFYSVDTFLMFINKS